MNRNLSTHKKSDCAVCLLKPCIILCWLSGIMPILIKNKHSMNEIFFKSKNLQTLSCVIVLMLSSCIWLQLNMVFSLKYKIPILIGITDLIFTANAVVCFFCGAINVKTTLKAVNGLGVIFQHRSLYGCSSLLANKTSNLFLITSYCYICIFVFFEINLSITIFMNNNLTITNLFKGCVMLLTNYIQSCTVFQCMLMTTLHKLLLKSCLKCAKNIMIKRRNIIEHRPAIITSLTPKIKKIIDLYNSIYINYCEYNNSLSIKFFIFWLLFLALLIIEIYIMILNIFLSNTTNKLVFVRVYATIFGFLIFLKVIEDINYVVSLDFYLFFFIKR